MSDYISITETNKLMRKVLKESFPGVKFSVRGKSYAGGGSTNIDWTDGPSSKQVESLISVFEGSYFDGMIDYKGSRYAWLDGREVSFMADFIFCNRNDSPELEQRIAKRLIDKYDFDKDVDLLLSEYHKGYLYDISPYSGADCTPMSPHTWQALIRTACAKHTFCPFPQSSPTLARVTFKGDDGYGAGCVGRDGKGEGYGGYPGSDRVQS